MPGILLLDKFFLRGDDAEDGEFLLDVNGRKIIFLVCGRVVVYVSCLLSTQ